MNESFSIDVILTFGGMMNPAYCRFSCITSCNQMKSWAQAMHKGCFSPTFRKNFSHYCFPIFLMIFTSCNRITENSDLANSGIPGQVALLMKNANCWYGMSWDGSAFLVQNDENDIRWWPVLVWTVNFTLSFSDRASDISTFGDVKFLAFLFKLIT